MKNRETSIKQTNHMQGRRTTTMENRDRGTPTRHCSERAQKGKDRDGQKEEAIKMEKDGQEEGLAVLEVIQLVGIIAIIIVAVELVLVVRHDHSNRRRTWGNATGRIPWTVSARVLHPPSICR